MLYHIKRVREIRAHRDRQINGWMDGWIQSECIHGQYYRQLLHVCHTYMQSRFVGSLPTSQVCVRIANTYTHTLCAGRSLARSLLAQYSTCPYYCVCVCVCVCVSLSLSLSPSNYSRGDEESHCHVAHVMTLTAMLLFLPLCVSSLLSPRCTCGMVVCCISF